MDACVDRVCRIARDIPLHSAELWRAEIQSFARADETGAARSESSLFELLSAGGEHIPHRNQAWSGRANCSTRQHLHVGGITFYQWLQSDPSHRRRARTEVCHSW